jgi:hypothetical protein
MDGVSINRINPARSPAPAGGSGVAGADSLVAIQRDALQLSRNGSVVASGGAAPVGGSANPMSVATAVMQDAAAAEAAGNPARAIQLQNYAGLIQNVGDSDAASLLALAYTSPKSSEQAARVAATLLGNNPQPSGWLAGMVAFDGPQAATYRASCPNNCFGNGATGAALVANLVTEIANPSQTSQGNRQTCGATTVQGMLASDAPIEYLRIVTSLAAFGSANLASGKLIQRTSDWNFQADGNRTLSSRLIQPALMSDASGGIYDNTNDISNAPGDAHKGLTTPEMQRLLSDITSQPTSMAEALRWDEANKRWLNINPGVDPLVNIQTDLAKGGMVPILLSLRPDQAYGHYERVQSITAAGVTCINPWGFPEVMSVDVFRQRLVAAFYQ